MNTRNKTTGFVAITFLITWITYLPIILHDQGFIGLDLFDKNSPVRIIMQFIANLGPVLSTCIFLFSETREFRLNYLKKLLSINFGFQFWFFYVPLIYLIAFVSIYFQKIFLDFNLNISPYSLLIIPLEMLLFGIASGGLEELGWRGYLRINLNITHGYFAGSVILGLIWSIWHLPLFLINGGFSGLNFIFFIFLEVGYSMILELVMIKTEGRTFAAILHHGAANHAITLFSIFSVKEIGNQYSFYVFSMLVLVTGFMLLFFHHGNKKKDMLNTFIL